MPDLGTKHECEECDTKFYDLGKSSPLCPKCGADASLQTPEGPAAKKASKAKKAKKAAAKRSAAKKAAAKKAAAKKAKSETPAKDDAGDKGGKKGK